jgi:hypothetical protein
MKEAVKKAFPDIRFVSVLNSFPNFRDSIEARLNKAATTPGILLL